MESRVGPDMTEVRVLCIPLEINDGGGRLPYILYPNRDNRRLPQRDDRRLQAWKTIGKLLLFWIVGFFVKY